MPNAIILAGFQLSLRTVIIQRRAYIPQVSEPNGE
jgi:hypothetical protein